MAKKLFLAYDIHEMNNKDFKGIENIKRSTIEQWLKEMRDQNLGGYIINIDEVENDKFLELLSSTKLVTKYDDIESKIDCKQKDPKYLNIFTSFKIDKES